MEQVSFSLQHVFVKIIINDFIVLENPLLYF